MFSRLDKDRKIRPLVSQFVALKVNSDGDQWQEWASKYKKEGKGIPIVYVIRADGKQLYGQSGAPKGDELPKFMKEHLENAGRVFPIPSAKKLQSLVETAKEQLENGDADAAVKAIKPLTRIGKLGDLGSHAQPAKDADEFVKKLIDDARESMADADSRLTADKDDVDAAVTLANISRVYAPLMKVEIVQVMKKYRRDLEVKALLKDAETIDKVSVKMKQRNGKDLAIRSLSKLLRKSQGLPVYDYIIENYEEMIGEPLSESFLAELEGDSDEEAGVAESSSSRPDPTDTAGRDRKSGSQADADSPGTSPTPRQPKAAKLGMRTWKTRDGKHQIEAEFVKILGEKVRLRKKNGKTTTIAIKRLSDEDRRVLTN